MREEAAIRVRLYIKAGQYEAAERYIRGCISEKPSSAELYSQLALIKHSEGQFSAAIEAWKKAIELDPENHPAVYSLVITYCDLGYYEEAEDLLANYKEQFHNAGRQALQDNYVIDNYINNANYYLSYNLHKEAAYEVFRALKIDENYFPARLTLGKIYAFQEKWGDALKEFEAAAKLKPDSTEALNWLGVSYLKNNRIQVAINQWDKVVELEPNNPTAKSYLAAHTA